MEGVEIRQYCMDEGMIVIQHMASAQPILEDQLSKEKKVKKYHLALLLREASN